VIYRFGTFDGAPYLVSELLEGGTLRQALERGPLPVRKAIDWGVQIAHGLAAAHDKGIVHRDLKPENLFVTKDGRVKILDFGLAKLVERELSGDETTMIHRTDPGMVMGAAGYMSPEQVRGTAVDHRADIFALGAILYELLTGKRAFQRSTSAETMTAILNDDPPSISQLAPVTPPGLQRVVQRCLEKNAEQRFQSASDLAFALGALSESSSIAPAVGGAAELAKRKPSRRARWIGGSITLCAMAIIAFFVLIGREKVPELRVTAYTQLTHSGDAGVVVGTDGARLYLALSISDPIGQVAITGGEIEPLGKVPPKTSLDDISPDGTTLLYRAYEVETNSTAPLYSLKVLGGAPRYLATVTAAAWTPDGKSILYDLHNGDLFLMNSDGTDVRKLTSAGGEINNFGMSPDGTHIRYLKNGSLWEMSSNGQDLHPLLSGWNPQDGKCCGAWSPDGSIFAFLVGPGAQLWAIDERSGFFPRPHSQPVQLTSSPINWSTPAFSKDGKQIYCMGSTSRGELIRFDPKSDQFRPFLGGISANLLSFSKDGQTVAYSTFPDGVLWKSNVDGTGRVQLTDPPLFPKRLAFRRTEKKLPTAPTGGGTRAMAAISVCSMSRVIR